MSWRYTSHIVIAQHLSRVWHSPTETVETLLLRGYHGPMSINIDRDNVRGDLIVDRQMWLGAKVSGSIRVVAGGDLTLGGACEGDVVVEKDGHALIAGTVAGEAVNQGGTLQVHGRVAKGVRTVAGQTQTSPHVRMQ